MSSGLLFAAAGTSSAKAAAAFRNIDRLAQARFPGVARYWAYTSGGVRRTLAARGTPVDDPAGALARLREEGVTRLAVQALHMAAGKEYGELRETVEGSAGFERCALSRPILRTPGLFRGIVRELLRAIRLPPGGDTALLLVAHGSREPAAQQVYTAAAARCRRFEARVLLGTLMAPLELPAVIAECRRTGARRVFLAPFTIAAGPSATREIAGSGPDSWQSILDQEGIACRPVLRGLGEYDGIARLCVQQAGTLMEQIS